MSRSHILVQDDRIKVIIDGIAQNAAQNRASFIRVSIDPGDPEDTTAIAVVNLADGTVTAIANHVCTLTVRALRDGPIKRAMTNKPTPTHQNYLQLRKTRY